MPSSGSRSIGDYQCRGETVGCAEGAREADMKVFIISLGLSVFCLGAVAQEKRPLSVSDCVQTRRLAAYDAIQVSPNGSVVAYVVKEANIMTNHDEYKVFVSALKQAQQIDDRRFLFQADSISGLRWLENNRRIAFLSKSGSQSEISSIDVVTGQREVLVSRSSPEIWDYSIDARGETVAFAIPVLNGSKSEGQDKLHGYSIKFRQLQIQPHPLSRHFEIFLLKTRAEEKEMARVEAGQAERPTAITSFVGVRDLSLSPDGNFLTFSYDLLFGKDEIPKQWNENPFVGIARSNFGALEVLGLYDVRKRLLQMAIDSPHADTQAVWSEDSRAYSVVVVPPVQSNYWEKPEIKKMHLEMGSPLFNREIFTVNVESRAVSQVLGDFVPEGTRPMSWKKAEGEMIVPSDGGTLLRLAWEETSGWKEISRFPAPFNPSRGLSGNGKIFVGVQETSTTPPALYLHNADLNKTTPLTELNPQFRNVTLGEVEKIEWTNKYGAETTGYLIKPVDYKQGGHYPLVVLAYGWGNEFLCDGSGSGHTTAFPPQPLANAGFLVLLANFPDEAHQPQDFPGEFGQAYNFVAMVESAVKLLVERGIADEKNVGLIGWSRTSWKTDFLITHSDVKLAAASSADSGIYNYGAYWLFNLASSQDETMYGGPPYGPSFTNWVKFAPAFGADKVNTPLIMEYMSDGGSFSEPNDAYEFFVALKRQGKPVELYFYPKGEHALDTPFERIASLQRNVDWFRFWMQGYEGKPPDYDPEQYVRWRKLRDQQAWNDHMRAQGKDPSVEFLRQTSPGAVVSDANRAPAAKEFVH
jgi:dipeptidyl aminopeptidase/acylaminoacyl peptidase